MRLGLSQPAFAALAGASKGAQANWEKGDATPNALALIAFAEAGADVLYILTGRRSSSDPTTAVRSIQDDLDEVRRDLLDPVRNSEPGDNPQQIEDRVLSRTVNRLQSMLRFDTHLMTPEQMEEAEGALQIATDPSQLAAFRAADFATTRKIREHLRNSIAGWFSDEEPAPVGTGMNILTTLALDYGAPVKLLVELVHELREDGAMLSANRT